MFISILRQCTAVYVGQINEILILSTILKALYKYCTHTHNNIIINLNLDKFLNILGTDFQGNTKARITIKLRREEVFLRLYITFPQFGFYLPLFRNQF